MWLEPEGSRMTQVLIETLGTDSWCHHWQVARCYYVQNAWLGVSMTYSDSYEGITEALCQGGDGNIVLVGGKTSHWIWVSKREMGTLLIMHKSIEKPTNIPNSFQIWMLRWIAFSTKCCIFYVYLVYLLSGQRWDFVYTHQFIGSYVNMFIL